MSSSKRRRCEESNSENGICAENFPELQNDRLLRAARGEHVDRVPIWLHRQAGRYLPEFRETRTKADFFTLCRTPELACEVTLQPLRRFDLDAAIIFSDILVIPQAVGMEVVMKPGKGPVLPEPLVEPSDLDKLKSLDQLDLNAELGYVFDAITLTRHRIEGKVPLIGFSGAPWTLMAYMIQGEGAKSYHKAKAWLYKYPDASAQLITLLTDVIVEYLVGQVAAGAQMLEVFDSWAGDLPPGLFRQFVLPSLLTIAKSVKSKCADRGLEVVPMTLFPKGAHFALEWLAESEYDVISLDWTIDPDVAREALKNGKTLQGNLEPSVLYASADVIDREAKAMVERFGTHRYIANLGHGMLPDHSPEAVKTLVDSVHAHSSAMKLDK